MCENCDSASTQLYYCELCRRNFCINCTIKEAHDKWYNKTTKILNCDQIHTKKYKLGSSLEDEQMDIPTDETNMQFDIENASEIKHCNCGKPYKTENFKCTDCGKNFCDMCPDAPIGENCLACLIVEARPMTSAPIKKC